MQPAIHGSVEPGYELVRSAFERNFTELGDVGAAFVVVVDGRTVVDLWGGVADAHTGAPWQADTLQLVFSGTKAFVAVCLLLLVERGQLALDEPVARYWPEFAAGGKADILVAHAVSHRAGLPALREPVTMRDIADDRRMAALLAAQPAFWPADDRIAYHSLTYGWLTGELVRRVDGRSLGTFFAEEVAQPLGLELWIGLPVEHEHRVSTLVSRPGLAAEPVPDDDVARLRALNPRAFDDLSLWNDPRLHRAEIGGAGAIGTARAVARLYGCLALGGELDGVRLMRPETLELGRTCLARGIDVHYGWPMAFGVGFALQTAEAELGPASDAFGHGGAGGSLHGAWPSRRTGFSYAMNEARNDLQRPHALLDALERVTRQA